MLNFSAFQYIQKFSFTKVILLGNISCYDLAQTARNISNVFLYDLLKLYQKNANWKVDKVFNAVNSCFSRNNFWSRNVIYCNCKRFESKFQEIIERTEKFSIQICESIINTDKNLQAKFKGWDYFSIIWTLLNLQPIKAESIYLFLVQSSRGLPQTCPLHCQIVKCSKNSKQHFSTGYFNCFILSS